jgi:hypothetical protein
MLGIKPFKVAIQKLQEGNDSEMTVCHSHFAMLCVAAKTYRQALPIISKKILTGYSDSIESIGSRSATSINFQI